MPIRDQIMLYSLPLHAAPAVQAFMDEMATLGVKVWLDMQPLGFTGASDYNYDRDWENPGWRSAVEGNISLVMNHSALLGYYIWWAHSHSHCSPCDVSAHCNLLYVTITATTAAPWMETLAT